MHMNPSPRTRHGVRGAALLLLLATLLPAAAMAGTFTVFGPDTFERQTSAPFVVTHSFAVLDPGAEYFLQIYNGGQNDEYPRVSSVIIWLNGQEVVRSNEFNKQVESVTKLLTLSAENELAIEVRSGPDSALVAHIFGIDEVAPTITATVSPEPNAAGWNNSDLVVSFECFDQTSGVVSCTPDVPFTDEASFELTGTAIDLAGNQATVTVPLKIDKTPPAVEALQSPEANAAGWNNTGVTAVFDCSDPLSGVVDCPAPVTLTAEGVHPVGGVVSDAAGNSAPVGHTISIDLTPPTLTAAPSPGANANGWNNTDVVVSFNAVDALSGVAAVTDPLTLGAEGADLGFTGTATDLAGNSATADGSVSIDRTPPTVEILSPLGGTVFSVEEIEISGVAADAVSGVDQVLVNGAFAVLDGSGFSAPETLSAALTDLQVQAIDLAGNTSSANAEVFFGRPETPVLDAHPELTNQTTVTMSGTVVGADSVEISGPVGMLEVPVTNGLWSADVELEANRENDLFFIGVSAVGPRSSPAAARVRNDTVPPILFIDFPAADAELLTDTTDVAGRVGDMLTGFAGLEVTVNGAPAIVDVGIGTNGTFFAENVPLDLTQPTLIQVEARDALGNLRTRQITVTHIEPPPGTPVIELISGNAQDGTVLTELGEPIVVRVLQANGTPFVDKIVNFDVTRSDGRLREDVDPLGSGSVMLQVRTDGQGIARAFWQMGSDAGCGNNRVAVSSADVVGTTFFCATADASPPGQINVGSGNDQRGEAGAPLTEPLRAWVNDGRNGVGGVPVTFTVVQGDASFGGQAAATAVTGVTGHAEVALELGASGGNVAVEASFPGNLGEPAGFLAFGVVPRPEQATAFEGLVIDNANRPVEGAGVNLLINNLVAAQTVTDADGQFFFDGIAAGPAQLEVDGTTAFAVDGLPVPEGSFPSLFFDTVIVANAINTLSEPARLPPLDTANQVEFDNTMDVALTVEGVEGLRMIVRAGSMTLADGSVPSALDPVTLSLNQVHFDDVPMPMPDGAAPPFAWTLQPAGAHFDPPVEVTYPNMSGLPPGSIAYFLSFNHENGEFEIVATGSVSDDGQTITSDPGAGIATSGWGCNCPPYSVAGDCCSENRSCSDNGQLTGGEVMTSAMDPTIGDTITFTASGVSDSGGEETVECPGGEEGTTTESVPAGTVMYEYTLSTPDGSMMGMGTTATVTAEKCGEYSVTFQAMVDRDCAPASINVGQDMVSVEAAQIAELEIRDGSRVAMGDGAKLEIVGAKTVSLKVTKDDESKEWLMEHPMWSGSVDGMGPEVEEFFIAVPDPGGIIVGPGLPGPFTVVDGCGGASKSGNVVSYPAGEKGFQFDFGALGDAVENALDAVPVFGSELKSKIQLPNGVVQFSNKWEEKDDAEVLWAVNANAGLDPLIGWSGKITISGAPDFIIEVLGGAQLNLVLGGKLAFVGTFIRNKEFPSGSGGVTISGGLTGGLQALGALPAGILVVSLGGTTGISGSGSLLYDAAGNDIVVKPKIELGGLKVEVKFSALGGLIEVTETWMPIESLPLYNPGKIILADGPTD